MYVNNDPKVCERVHVYKGCWRQTSSSSWPPPRLSTPPLSSLTGLSHRTGSNCTAAPKFSIDWFGTKRDYYDGKLLHFQDRRNNLVWFFHKRLLTCLKSLEIISTSLIVKFKLLVGKRISSIAESQLLENIFKDTG